MDLLLARFLLVATALGWCLCRAQMMKEQQQILILKTIVDSIEKLTMRTEDQERKMDTLQDSLKSIQLNMRDLEEIRGSVQECSSKEQISDIKTILTTDECEDGTHECSDDATCNDETIHYTCSCLPGFSGDGFTCIDIDECSDQVHKCHPKAICQNTAGGYNCSCPMPYKGDGFSCDMDECHLGIHDCHVNATCTNTDNGFECSCPAPFIGNGTHCDPCHWPSVHLPDYGCIVPKPDCQWPSINLPDLGCITPIMEYMSWYNAKSKCEESGKRLVEELTEKHIKLLSELYLPLMKDNKQPWIGAQHSKWLTSGNNITVNLFKGGEPDGGEEVCNYLNLGNTLPIGIGDAKCSANGRVVCQFIY